MIDIKIIEFLEELKQNNSKEWFDINRKRYEQIKENYIEFVRNLILEISTFDSEISYLLPKDCIFRINRDIRFSNDKAPYKTYFGAYIVKGGKKSGNSGYYLHLEPDNYFIAGGIYNPTPEALKNIREEIYYNPEKFLEIINKPDYKKTYGDIWGEKLKKAPKGFDADFEYIEYLKFKSFVSYKQLEFDEIISENFLNTLTNYFKITYNFNKYLNNIIIS